VAKIFDRSFKIERDYHLVMIRTSVAIWTAPLDNLNVAAPVGIDQLHRICWQLSGILACPFRLQDARARLRTLGGTHLFD
jgi:hypothetical protein